MANFRILIADDDEDDYFIIREAFNELTAHDITYVSDGQQLLEFLDLQVTQRRKLPDLILLDINMPKIDGIRALESIKSSQALNRIPIVMYSTSHDPEQKRACRKLGANGFISKGYSHSDIIDFAGGVNNFLEKLRSDPTRRFVHNIKGVTGIK